MWEERTGISTNKIVVVIAVEGEEPQVFEERRDHCIGECIQTIARYLTDEMYRLR